MVNYCSKCGAKVIEEESLFCEYCGSKLKRSTLSHSSVPPPIVSPVYESHPRARSQTSSQRFYGSPYKSQSSGIKWFFVVIFICMIGFASVVAIAGLFIILPISTNYSIGPHEYIGDKDYYLYDWNNISKLELEIDNSVGSVDIEYKDNMSLLLQAQISVYARRGHSLEDAKTFEAIQYDDVYDVSFDSASESYRNNPYTYELDITISKLAYTSLDVDVSTGSIHLIAHETSISHLSLESSTGSITSEFQGVFFDEPDHLFMSSSTGAIVSSFKDVTYSSNDVEWQLDTSTGSINVGLFQSRVVNDTRINYFIDTSTGSISCNYNLNPLMGLSVEADTSTGAIYTSGYSTDDKYTYTSENYYSASMKYNLELSSSTGSISINLVS